MKPNTNEPARLMPIISRVLTTLIAFAAISAQAAEVSAADDARRIIPLDGTWQIEGNDGAAKPESFPHTIPVPGVVKLAKPGWEKPLAPLGPGHESFMALMKSIPENEKKVRREAIVQEGKQMGFSAYWYRRTVRIDGDIPEVALLQVAKARWGVKAWVNGQEVGEHNLIHTAGIFDVRDALKGGGAGNEIVLRIGGRVHEMQSVVPKSNPWSGSMPGVYDSVCLILSGSPRIVRTQAVPQLADGSVRFVGLVRNTGEQPHTASVTVAVRDDGSDTVLATSEPQTLTIEPGAEKEFDCTVKLPEAKLWSPESPHLYAFTVEAKDTASGTRTDRLDDRFGMREFRIDPKTGAATLNRRHVFLRGAGVLNVTDVMEHPDLADHVWREDYARRALRNIKEINGNAARSAFDFMPELWYRIADEEGIMIQDEALSGARNSKPEALVAMFTQWIHERANHPCVIIWDASNETRDKKELHPAIAAVRHLDLSNRPWDCSWVPTGVPGDVSYEKHPYDGWGKNFSMERIGEAYAEKEEFPNGGHLPDVENVPLKPGWIVNEFCGVFLRSGGKVSTMFPSMFLTSMDPDASPADRFVVRARYYAAELEVRRRKPGCIGVLWNPYLHGSDRHVVDDVTIPRIEKHFFRFVKDASAPVGVMLAFFDDTAKPGKSLTVPVAIANDSLNDWSGTVTVAVLKGERNLLTKGVLLLPPAEDAEIQKRKVAEWTVQGRAAVGERREIPVNITMPSAPGLYLLMAEVTSEDGKPVRSWRDLQIQ